MEIEKLSVQLKGFSGQVLDKIPDRSKPLNINVSHKARVEKVEGTKTYLYHLSTDVAPEPRALFTCQVNQVIQVDFVQDLAIQEAKNVSYDLCSQAANLLSFLIGTMTKELIDTPIIIPPSLNFEAFEII